MSDTGSYDENIEVQETNFSSGGDNVSVSSRGSSHHSSHHHSNSHHHHHQYGHNRGAHYTASSGTRYYSSSSKSSPTITDWGPFKCLIRVVCVMLIAAGLYVFISSNYKSLTQKPPPPPPPKAWSGNFAGSYQKQNDGAWAKDSASKSRFMLKSVADLDGQMYISTNVIKGNGTTTTIYEVMKSLDRGSKVSFNFTSGVRFTQQTTRQGKRILKLRNDEPDYYFEEFPTTISVEQWAEGGKKGIWREVQHSRPEVKIKRIFFDDEMTAIYQCKSEHYSNRWDIYVVRYNRR